jgi:penicillin-binding protein-related factor A (putative recombinase)
MSSKYESKFLTEIINSREIICPGAFFYKIPDPPIFKGSKTRFNVQRPYDLEVAWAGKLLAVEAKVHRVHTAWPISKVAEHQIENLKCNKVNGKDAYVVINVRYGLGKSRVNFAAIIDIDEIIELKKENKKSITVSELREYRTMQWQKSNGVYIWNLFALL